MARSRKGPCFRRLLIGPEKGPPVAARGAPRRPCHSDSLRAVRYEAGGIFNWNEALPLYKRALGIREAQLGPDHPDTASSLNHLVELHKAMGQHAAALALYCSRRPLANWKRTLRLGNVLSELRK
jgi:hypothetical protein